MKNLNKAIGKKRKIINNYNKTASFYDNRYRKIQEQKYETILNNYHSNAKLILDAGCGTGLFTDFIITLIKRKGFTPFIYVGTDISLGMLDMFKMRLQGLKMKKVFNLILSDLENLPFRENIFQSIFSLTSFQNLPNIDKGVRNLYRVGKNNADLNISILKKKNNLIELIELLRPLVKNLKTTNKENLEDIIIQCMLFKRI
ncbi:MAG: class I SAM-dependent methyltransferase [Candidatus Hodarchaeota archaeon]